MRNTWRLTVLAALTTVGMVVAGGARAADIEGAAALLDAEAGKRVWGQTAGCIRCHGWAGDGTAEGPGFAAGANLRKIVLDAAALKEIIRCGVPGSAMPSFNRNAYGSLPCFGMTAAQVGQQKPPTGEVSLADTQVDNLVAYLLAKVMNRGPITKGSCMDYYGPTNAFCDRY